MPFNWGALLGGALQAGSTLFNIGSQNRTNREARQYADLTFEKEKQRDIDFFNMQNSYNSPQAQMKRLQDAGLNPNLVYGNGSAVTSSATPHASGAQSYSPRAPRLEAQDIMTRVLQSDNLKAQNDVLLEEKLLKRAQTRATLANAGLSEFNLGFRMDSRSNDLSMKEAQLESQTLRNIAQGVSNFYQSGHEQNRLDESLTRILRNEADNSRIDADRNRINALISNIRADTRSKELDADLKQLDKDLRQNGINPNDPTYARWLMRFLMNRYGSDFPEKAGTLIFP